MRNNFDDILKRKWEQQSFPVDESHREEMIRLLEQQPKRKPLLFWWLGSLGVIGCSVALLIFASVPSGPMASHTASRSLDPMDKADPLPHNDRVMVDEIQNQIKSPAEETKTLQSKASSRTEPSPANTNARTTAKVVSRQYASSGKPQSIEGTNDPKNSTQKSSEKDPSPLAMNAIINAVNENDPDAYPVAQAESVGTTDEELLQNLSSKEAAAIHNTFITEQVPVLPVMPVTTSKNDAEPEVSYTKVFKPSYEFFVEAGTGIIPSFQQAFRTGWTLHGGAGIGYAIAPKTKVTLSGGYLYQREGFEFERSSTVQQPSFGARSVFHTLSPDRLHFVYGKMALQHHITRHVFSLQAGLQYLYGAQGTIVIHTDDQLQGLMTKSDYAWLELSGMNRWLWHSGVTYGYQFTPRLSIHGGMKYFFSSIKMEDPTLENRGFYWQGRQAALQPLFTLKYEIYGNR